jgi:YebC/PmpR family DNA-binding regulatory protein
MSGHSKWHQIRYKKGITDAKRGQMFTKVARMISVAAREGGGDPETNYKLRLAIDKAKEINMPKDSIQKAIDRGTGKLAGARLEKVTYEGYAPSGVALLIDVLTDNKNRASAEIKNILGKGGGKMGGAGSVAWMFSPKGVIRIETRDLSPEIREELELAAIDAGVLDFKEEKDLIEIYTKPEELHKIKEELQNKGYQVSSAEILQIPKNIVKIEDEKQAEQILKLMEALEDSEEVSAVHSNFDIEDRILEAQAV